MAAVRPPVDQSSPPAAAAGRLLTLGTAGHIDHGKTALVTRLTGKNTDRLAEERERGISIELGYAELDLPGGRRLSVVDVPGHERFVRTMVAGATGVDLFLLVIAADDGVMPQTVEHLAVLELLGVRRGVVALTKADLVDDELLELARADVREFLADTPFATAPVVTVSARDGRGLEDLLAALESVAAEVDAGLREGLARLPVDRVFPLKGIGTVVTGTLWRGHLAAGDAVAIEPGGGRATVRSVQVHDHDAESALAGGRVGVNLRGVDRGEIVRGQWLVSPHAAGRVHRRFAAAVRLLPGARPLKSGRQVRLHHGTAQFLARISPLEGGEIAGGQKALAVVRLDGDAAVEPHDRFILRSLSPPATIGGGVVLDVGQRRWADAGHRASHLSALESDDLAAAARALSADRARAGLTLEDLGDVGLGPDEAGSLLQGLVRDGELETLRGHWFAKNVLHVAGEELSAAAGDRAKARPDRPFTSAGELAAAVPGLPAAALEALLGRLVEAGRLVAAEGGYAPAGAAGVLSPADERLAQRALTELAAEPLAPPTLATLAETTGAAAKDLGRTLDVLARRGEVVRVDKDLWFARAAVDRARDVLLRLLAEQGEVALAGYRDALVTGRRNAQALLELFDREGLTRRRGDVRVARTRH